ncbi:MAG: [FeFe] hydrogenase H-cluster radical SAM maturase HydE [Treponema sp.]|nr:[FeFe] hydrogenase H-cluster radical SAM maturase HydE [Treponema sp.]
MLEKNFAQNADVIPRNFSDAELLEILKSESDLENLRSEADAVRKKIYGDKVYIRGLIEFSNFCKNDCFYCGIRASNKNAERYRLSKNQILECCAEGHALGFRTFVLQSGEDFSFDDELCETVREIKNAHPDCAVTLSVGERPRPTYQKFFDAGADRFLLRHESANAAHYKKLHPQKMSGENRKRCLFDLREIGFQVGAGFMVGAPFQTDENIIEDLRFMQELKPHMIGIGPFIAHKQTPFADFPNGSVQKTLNLLSVIRLMFPKILLPATTALGTLCPDGREKGLLHGANVLMPNLSPVGVRKLYSIYENKICTGEEAAQCRGCLERRVKSAGYRIVVDKGDAPCA